MATVLINLFRMYPLLITESIITYNWDRLYYALRTHFATGFKLSASHYSFRLHYHLLLISSTTNNLTMRHSSTKEIVNNQYWKYLYNIDCLLFHFVFFFCLFLFCRVFLLNLLDSTTPWQHIRRGFPLSGVWSVSNRISHTFSVNCNSLPISRFFLFLLYLLSCVFV